MKTAIVTGLGGMDGTIITEQLLQQNYKVYGVVRRTARGTDINNANHLIGKPNLEITEGDIADLPFLLRLCKEVRSDSFVHTAAQSHVGSSFEQPINTIQTNTIGTLNCLEAIRLSGIHTRFLHCATSEMFGGLTGQSANEITPFHPRSPYGVSKVGAFWATINYRESYKMFACNTICFNHEHFFRSNTFVTRKITQAVARIKAGKQDKLFLGNLDAKRDWGWAPDYCRGMIMILESNEADDYVLATGETHTIREFCEVCFNHVGLDYRDYVVIDPKFYRPAEVDILIGDYSKIKNKLGWEPRTKFKDLAIKMLEYDIQNIK